VVKIYSPPSPRPLDGSPPSPAAGGCGGSCGGCGGGAAASAGASAPRSRDCERVFGGLSMYVNGHTSTSGIAIILHFFVFVL
jgi:hypothetical protein